MNDKTYFSRKEIDQSLLKHMLRSPAHFRWAQLHRGEEKGTESMLLGRAIHAAVLQPGIFKRNYARIPDRRTAAGKAAAEAAEAAGKILLSVTDYEQTVKAAGAIRAQSGSLLKGTKRERAFFWTDTSTRLKLKARLDAISDGAYILDLKTCKDADTEAFRREAYKLGYHIQAGFYQMAVEARTGKRLPFIFLAAEKAEPYAVHILRASEEFIEAGRWAARELLDKVAECEKAGIWPGYEDSTLDLPSWAEV